jgi:phosphoribosylglycinamide formyltransferase 2
MSNRSEDKYLGTPLLEGATTLMLIGGTELGREILIEAHRLGLETVLISDHQYAPASHLSHRRYVIRFDDEQGFRAILRREQPEIVIQDSPSIEPQTLQNSLEDIQPAIFPQPSLETLLQDRFKTLETANRAKSGVVPYALASSSAELKEACNKLGFPCFVQETTSTSEMPEILAKSPRDIDSVVGESKDQGNTRHFLIRKFVPYDLRASLYAIASKFGSREESLTFSQPIATLGTSNSPHASWQPLWTIDEHTRMSTAPFSGYGASLQRKEEGPSRDYLWESEWNGRYVPADLMRDVENKLREYSSRTLSRLQEDSGKAVSGVLRFDFGIQLKAKESGNKPDVLLENVSPYPNETAFLTLATQEPSIPACVVGTALGMQTRRVETTASGATHIIQARQKSGWAPAFFNVDGAMKQEGTFIQLFGKHRFTASETVGIAFALDHDVIKAREKALTCAHAIEDGIDYGE